MKKFFSIMIHEIAGFFQNPSFSKFDILKKPLLCIVSLFLFFSCSSALKEKKQDPFVSLDRAGEFDALAEGGGAYLSIDVPGSRPVLDLLSFVRSGGKDAALILDKTGTVTAAFYPKGSGQAFMASVRGAYPKGLADFALGFAKDWKKKKSVAVPVRYWYSETNKLSLAFNEKHALVSDTDPFVPTQALTIPGAVPPGGFGEFRQDAVIAGWLGNAGSSLSTLLGTFGFPFEIEAKELFFKVMVLPVTEAGGEKPAALLYETLLRIEAPSEDAAAGLANLFALVRRFTAGVDETPRDAPSGMPLFIIKKFFANTPKRDGVFLNVSIGAMDAEQMALLFNLFSVNLN